VLGQLAAERGLGIRRGAREDLSVVAGRIRQSERRFRSMIENAHDLFVICDIEGTLLYVSPSVRGVAGVNPEDILGSSQNDMHHPDDLSRLIEAFSAAVRNGRAEVDFRFRHRDGSWRWLQTTIINLLDDPDVGGIVLAGRDVTERKQVEEALRVNEERWRSLLMNSSDVITVLDDKGDVIYASPSIDRLLGLTSDQILDMSVFALVHPDDLERAGTTLLELIDSEGPSWPIEMRVRHVNGDYRSIEAVAKNMLDDPNIGGIVINVRDVTERKLAEAALSVNEERWRALVKNSTDAITVLGPDARVIYTSPSVERLLGYDPDPLTQTEVFEVVHPDDLAEAAASFQKLLNSDNVSDLIEMRVRHADGTYHWIEAVANNLLDDPAIGGIVVNVRDVTERKRAEEELARQAMSDSLTGLANRIVLVDRVASASARSERTGKLTAVLFLDLDHFKLVNDGLGHAVGDQLLITVADRLQRFLRKGDTAARLGGDEFVLCCENIESYSEAADIADRLAEVLGEPINLDGQDVSLTVSVGITCACDGSRSPEDLLRDADVAMYRAKERGRARSEVFLPSMGTRARERFEQQLDVRRALTAGQFRMTYQPLIHLSTNELAGAEALVRWAHPRQGLVLPGEFIPAAEETGLIEPLGRWVLGQAVAEAAAWDRESPNPLGVAVNISARQIAGGQLPTLVRAALDSNGFDARRLCLEITESVLVEEPDEVEATLTEVADLGVRIAIDDFGTGYSSLAYVKRFPVSILKVDRSFVAGIEDHADNRAIVEAIVGLASSLGLMVVAEGVETAEQLRIIKDIGCDLAQGFYIGHSIPPEAFEDLVRGSGTR
jgi:diguanylate cyclase (GGDEF)-like protein/PAS domain S-box-containing protein